MDTFLNEFFASFDWEIIGIQQIISKLQELK